MLPRTVVDDAAAVIAACRAAGIAVATAESCTGGLIAGALTEVAGSSDAVSHGFVTYSNAAKQRQLGVPQALLQTHGAVSEPVAEAMATGCLATEPPVDVAVAVTGVAGPGGGSPGKPVGTVCFGLARRGVEPRTETRHFDGDRSAVREATVRHALALLLEAATGSPPR